MQTGVLRRWCSSLRWLSLLAAIQFSGLTQPPARSAEVRGWLGAYTSPVSPLPALPIPEDAWGGATSAIRIDAVIPGSPAARSGIRAGDLILGIEGAPFACSGDSAAARFRRALERSRPGAAFACRVLSNAVEPSFALTPIDPDRGARLSRLFWKDPIAAAESLATGETLAASLSRNAKVRDLMLVLGIRPEQNWPAAPSDSEIDPEGRWHASDFAGHLEGLLTLAGIVEPTRDLEQRLAACQTSADPARLDAITFAHRHPDRLEAVARDIADGIAGATSVTGLLEHAARFYLGAALGATASPGVVPNAMSSSSPATPPAPSSTPPTKRSLATSLGSEPVRTPAPSTAPAPWMRLDEWITEVEGRLHTANTSLEQAFSALSPEDKAFVAAQRWILTEYFAEEVYLHSDSDTLRFRDNQRLLELAAKVDRRALVDAARAVAPLTEVEWAQSSARALSSWFADSLDQDLLLDRPTEWGRILVAGTSRNWHRDDDVALLFDLGGDDFYTGKSGASDGFTRAISILVDAAGQDAYESTRFEGQGCGSLGVGGLLDLEGNDSYLGPAWNQGTGFLGIGWLHDAAGDDVYRGQTFAQGVGLYGIGLLLDESGDDAYSGDAKVQGVGLAGAIGILADRRGDDRYFAKGRYPTGYGDAGIFDAWSQGCGMGFRTLASGGIGVLSDGDGCDRMEAGNFAQGGGYYYGLGLADLRGADDDTYVGSR